MKASFEISRGRSLLVRLSRTPATSDRPTCPAPGALPASTPTSASFALPFDDSTVWSTMIEPPISLALPPACWYWLRKFDGVGAAEPEVDRIDVVRQRRRWSELKSSAPSGTQIRLVIWPPRGQ